MTKVLVTLCSRGRATRLLRIAEKSQEGVERWIMYNTSCGLDVGYDVIVFCQLLVTRFKL